MKKYIIILITVTTGLFSCRQGSKSTPDTVNIKTLGYIDTKYEYTDSTGRNLIIQNSLPKSGIHYTDPTGTGYIYAVFWTRIINETDNPCELTIGFPAELRELPSAPGVYYRLFFPPDTMTVDKEPLYSYGLTRLKYFLDNGLSKPSSLKRTINPKDSSAFYVVTLSNKGVGGTIRAGFAIKDQNILYRINKDEIHCGKINIPLQQSFHSMKTK